MKLLNGLHAARKTGLDVSLEQIARGKEQFPHLDLRTGSGETAVLPGGPFDVIILSDVLNYAADVEVLLRHLQRAPIETRDCSSTSIIRSGARCLALLDVSGWRPRLMPIAEKRKINRLVVTIAMIE